LSLGDLGILEEKSVVPTVKEVGKKWLDYIRSIRRETTAERYQNAMDLHILPNFGERPINSIKRPEIKDFLLQKVNEGYSRGSVALMKDVLSGVFTHAWDAELIESNPVTGIWKRLKLAKDAEAEVEALTPEEANLFLETCREHYSEYFPFFQTATYTGLRLGELLGVKWGDVDFNSHFINVQRTYRRGSFGRPKNGKTRRVDMADELEATLKWLLNLRKKEALEKGKGEVEELVFHDGTGKPTEQNSIRRIFKRALKKAGLREIRLHSLRHTYASLLLSQGVSPVYVKEQMGHHSISITVDIYGHWIRSGNRDAVNHLSTQVSASHTQANKIETAQPIEITPLP